MTAGPPAPLAAQARGAALGLAAAALFGLSAPVAMVLLGEVSPVLLAGLLYLGAAIGLWTHRVFSPPTKEASLGPGDAPKLAAVVFSGCRKYEAGFWVKGRVSGCRKYEAGFWVKGRVSRRPRTGTS